MIRPGSSFGVLALLACSAHGQSPAPPVMLGVNPPGATIGQVAEWSIVGRDLTGVDRVVVSGPGLEVVGLSGRDRSTVKALVRVAADAPAGYREVRLDGPHGVSNLALVRVDSLRQVPEADRGGDSSKAQEVEEGWAVVGLLEPLDVDLYRVRGTPGHRLTLDLEARRIGTSIAPVLSTLAESGVATAQAREARGGDRDCRLGVVVPPGGSFLVQVRDNTYGGGDRSGYRLRVDSNPFATAAFPLGGARGSTVAVEVSGGTLSAPLWKSVTLPDVVGSTVEVGAVDGPGGTIVAPGRLVAGEGPEVLEPADRTRDSPIDLTPGLTVNGRLARPGEVDAYRIPIKAGGRVRARIEAEAPGSWLDSVIVVRDDKGVVVAEADDIEPDRAGPRRTLGGSDTSVEFEAKTDGLLTVEVSDRFGDGGPEFGYRLTVGPPWPDFSVTLLLGQADPVQAASSRNSPGQFGAFNLKAGSTAQVPFLVAPEGRTGPVEVRVEGLPEGVSAESVTVRLAASTVSDSLRLKVARDAPPGLAELTVVATARPSPGRVLVRRATATLVIASAGVGSRPVTRVISRFPIRIIGPAPRSGG